MEPSSRRGPAPGGTCLACRPGGAWTRLEEARDPQSESPTALNSAEAMPRSDLALLAALHALRQASRIFRRRRNREPSVGHQLDEKLLCFRMRDRGLNSYAHQAARPIERNPSLAEQTAVDAVAAAFVVRLQVCAMIHQNLNDLGTSLVRRAVQGRAS